MSPAVKRAIRTLIQGASSAIVTILTLAGFDVVPDWAFAKKVLIAAILGAGASLFSFIQNALEDKGAIPTVLKEKEITDLEPMP